MAGQPASDAREDGDTAVSPGPGRDWKAIGRKAIMPVIGLAIVVGIFAAIIPHFADYKTVWKYMTNLTTGDWALIAVCTVANIATSGPPWMAAVPTLSYKRAMLLTQTGLLMTSVLPMGEAVGFGTQVTMLRRWRFSPHAVTAGFLLVAVWNQGINTMIPIGAVIALGAGHANPLLYTVSLIAAGVLVLLVVAAVIAFRSDEQARRIGELAGRAVSRLWVLIHRAPRVGWGERLANMRSQTIDVVARRWHVLTIATLANQLTLFGVMLACLHATGVTGISFVEALAAWAFARLIGSIAITPAGLGIQELGLTGALVAFGGQTDQVIATALLFRVLTFVPTIIVGSVCAIIWRREEKREAAMAATAS